LAHANSQPSASSCSAGGSTRRTRLRTFGASNSSTRLLLVISWSLLIHSVLRLPYPLRHCTRCCRPAGCQGTAYFNWDRGRAFDPLVAAVIEDDLVSCNRTFEVLSSTGKRVTRNPPEPLNTVELQKRACRVTRASPHQVLQWAEELYQSGYISYPRTETNKYPSTFDLNAITHELTNHGHFGQYAHSLLSQGLSRPRAGNQDDGAHPPIYPAKHIDPNSIGGQSNGKYLVYELVARHFLATVSPLAVGRSTEVNVQCASETFTAKGLCIERHGYLDVYGPSSQFSVSFDRWSGSGDLPRKYTQGEVLQATRVSLEEGKTEPPALLTEPELISAMDRAQIGTDATQAAHIEKVVGERGYAERTAGDRLKPTNLGEALAYGYKQIGLHEVWRPDFRAKMEAQVNSIATNQSTSHPQWHDVLQNLLSESVTQYSTASAGKQQLESSLTALLGQASRSAQPTSFSLGLCPSGCRDEISVRRERDGTWRVACACRPRNKDLELERLPKVAGNLCASANVCQQPTCTAVGSLNLLHFSLPADVLHPNESRYSAGVDLCVFCEQAAACTAARVLRDQERACNQQREQPYAYQQRAQQPPDHQAPLQAQQQLPNAHFTSLQSNSQWQAQPAQQHGQGHPPRSSGRSGSMGRQGSSTGRGTTGRGKQSSGGRGDVSGGNRAASAGGASSQAQACKGRMGSRGVRGRGRKGGKNSKGCFKCGAKNHWANSCPQSN